MGSALDLATIAALLGDPARANIVLALMDGRARTASELAYAARVTPQTASGHLKQLVAARLLEVAAQGRHRYFRLAGAPVAAMIESMMAVAADVVPRLRPVRVPPELVRARLCYDHLAGRLGVAIADAMVRHGALVLSCDGGEVTETGFALLREIGVDIDAQRGRQRVFCRACLDWSERRFHVGGAVGAALAQRCFEQGWLARERDSRAVHLTPPGRAALEALFGPDVAMAAAA